MASNCINPLNDCLERAISIRSGYIDGDHIHAYRLFAGFYEGCPAMVADVYARTLVLFGYGETPEESESILNTAQDYFTTHLSWIDCVVQKIRSSQELALQRGSVAFGNRPASQVKEHEVWYAVDLIMSQDASFYLDTRALRQWLLDNSGGKSVLNLFAYTGALGVAALAGGAEAVIQVDRNLRFMELALRSCYLNHLDSRKMKLMACDCFPAIGHFKHTRALFDVVVVDPPFFSTTSRGTVDLVKDSTRLVNKARPLVKDGGHLVVINNALFLKGSDFLSGLEELCRDGYLSIEEILPVPQDVTGFPETGVSQPPVDPTPFNHPTKIAVLGVKRKKSPQ